MVAAAKDKIYWICNHAVGDRIDSDHRLIRRGIPIDVINEVIEEKAIEFLILSQERSKGAFSGFRTDFADKFMKHASIPFVVLPV